MPLQKRLVKFAAAVQDAKDSPATAPEYEVGVSGGQLLAPEVEEEDRDLTADSRVAEARDRLSVVVGANAETLALPQSLGLFLLGALGSVSTTGTGPFDHEFSVADDLPYLTLFTDYGKSEYHEVQNAKVNSLELSFEDAGAVDVAVEFMGTDLVFLDSAYTDATTEEGARNALRGAGGTLNVDGAGAKVIDGTVTVTNELEALTLVDGVTPDDVFPGKVALEVSLTIVPENLDLFRETLGGSASATGPQDEPYYGSFGFTFTNGTDTLQVSADEMAMLAEFPDADPEGGPAEVALEGVIVEPAAGGDAVTYTLTNGVSSY